MNAFDPFATRRVLVVGLGTAGLTAAIRLHQTGWDVTALERAATLRGDGYHTELFGAGVSVAQRMAVLDAIGDHHDADSTLYQVDRRGRRGPAIRQLATGMRPLLSGDVERALFEALPDGVDARFSTSPTEIVQTREGVLVSMYNPTTGQERTERFDLVVGADGVWSTVRRLAFGPHENYLHSMDHIVATCLLSAPVAGLRPHDGLTLAEPGRSAWVFPFVDRLPSLMMTYRAENVSAEFDCPPGESLRRAFGGEPLGPVLKELIEQYENAESILFDSAEQVRMPSWRAGRVVMIGDAAWSLTIYSGMGTSSAMAGADMLAVALQQHPGDIPVALGEWEHRMRPFIEYHQNAIDGGLNFFVPQDRLHQLTRSMAVRLSNVPLLGIAMREARANSQDFVMKNHDVTIAASVPSHWET